MSKGSKVAAVLLTAVLGTAGASVVSAAGATPTTGTLNWTVNGQSVEVRTLSTNGHELVAVADAAKALGAEIEVLPNGAGIRVTLDDHTVLIKASNKTMEADGKTFSQAVEAWKNTNYVDASSYVQALGGTYSPVQDGVTIQTLRLLESADTVQFAGPGRLVVSVEGENGRTDYLVDATTGNYNQLLSSNGASELVISPDGTMAAFTEADGTLFTIDLATMYLTKVNNDTTIKSNLQWSADNKTIYFLQTDKATIIATADLATGTIKTLLDDKVDYKGDLSVTGNGLSYSVTKTSKVTADANKDVDLDDVAIDTAGTTPQLYDLDLSKTPLAAVQLTKTDVDKLFVQRSEAGTVYFVQAGDENTNSKLAAVTAAGQTFAFDKEDVQEVVQAGSFIGILTDSSVYVLNETTNALTRLADAPDASYGLSLSNDGSSVALIAGGQLQVLNGGKWVALTK